jgi:hypothetical protein
MRFVAVFILVMMSIGQASAQRFTGNTVFMAVQCDVGRFAETAQQIDLDPRMRADIDFSWTVEKSTKVDASVGLSSWFKWLVGGPTVEQSLSWKKIDDNHMKGPFNIHEQNTAACQENVLKVPLGIHDCLADNTNVLKSGLEASCDKTTSVEGTLNAVGKIDWKVVEASLGGEWDLKATYRIIVSAPAKAETTGLRLLYELAEVR